MDNGVLDVTYTDENKEVIDDEDLERYGIGGFSIRFTVLAISVDSFVFYAGLLPLDRREIEEKLEEDPHKKQKSRQR
jgi:hypothetical protein